MVLAHAGYSLSLVGDTAEGLRHAARAVRKAPGSGMTHHYHGVCLLYMRRFEEAVVAFETACRLMPGSPVLVYTRLWQAGALAALDRTAEAEACCEDAIAINPSMGMVRVSKALLCLGRGDVAEARSHMDAARHAGWSEALAVRVHRAGMAARKESSGRIENELAALRALYAATEPVSGDAGEVQAGPEGTRS
jgi:Flp pilus assembly protein TadD